MVVALADVKTYLGVSGGAEDTFLTSQIAIVSEAIEGHCRRKFELATYTQTFYRSDYRPGPVIDLFMYPVKQVNSILQDDVELVDGWRLQKSIGRLTYADGFFWGEETVIEYEAGFDPIPETIKAVAYSIIEERYNKKKSGIALNFGNDVQRVSIPGAIAIDFDYSLSNNERKTPFGTILGNHLNVLDFYRSDRAILGSGKLIYV